MSYNHSIIYKPTCGSCGAVIHGTVSSRSWQYKCASGRGVWPTRCPNCGTYFYSIVMPNPSKWILRLTWTSTLKLRGGQNE